MATVEKSARIAVMAVCLDATSYQAVLHFISGVPGTVMVGNLDHYVGVERELGRPLDLAHIRIGFIDYDQNTREALWTTERLLSEDPTEESLALPPHPDPEPI